MMPQRRAVVVLSVVIPLVAAAAGTPCNTDRECPGEEVCEAHVCTLPKGAAPGPGTPAVAPPPIPPPVLQPPAPLPPPAFAPPPMRPPVVESEPPEFTWCLQLTGDVAPASSVKVPFQSAPQKGFFGMGQAGAGVLLPGAARILALVRAGYGAGGLEPGKGDDGVFGGGGLYLGFQFIPEISKLGRLEPFLRATYDVQVMHTSDNTTGTLSRSAFGVALGVLAWKGQFGLHVGYGGDAAGGTSVFFGATLGMGR